MSSKFYNLMKIFGKLLKKSLAPFTVIVMRLGFPRLALVFLQAENSLLRPQRISRLMSLSCTANGGAKSSLKIRSFFPFRTFRLGAVKRHGCFVEYSTVHERDRQVNLPAVDLKLFQNVEIVGGSEMIVIGANCLLYDELSLGDPNRYGCKALGIIPAQSRRLRLPAFHKGQLLVSYFTRGRFLSQAIHLCKDHSANYYHWLFECLPRAIVALQQQEYADWPLLVDANIPVQNMQALRLLSGSRKIISVDRAEIFKVEKLLFPSVFSFTHDNYGSQVHPEDFVIAPEAVSLLRHHLSVPFERKANRKLYITRDRARYRILLNEHHIQAALSAHGFDIVRPEEMSFSEQRKLFSEASAIVGPTGAGLSNMVFAPPGCKVVVLAGDTYGANYYIFGQIGNLLNHDLNYLVGNSSAPGNLHSDYKIDFSQLGDVLAAQGLVDKVLWVN